MNNDRGGPQMGNDICSLQMEKYSGGQGMENESVGHHMENDDSCWLKMVGFQQRTTVVRFRWKTTAMGFGGRTTVVGYKWRPLVVGSEP